MLETLLRWYGEATYTDGDFTWIVRANSIGSKHVYTIAMLNKERNKRIRRHFESIAGVETAMLQYGASIVEGWTL